jgi:integrase
MARKRRLTTCRKGSPNRYCNFTVNGCRFRHSLGTDDAEEAEILADNIRRQALLGNATGKLPEMSLTEAFGRYWLEHAQHLPSKGDIKLYSTEMLAEFGKAALLSDLTTGRIGEYAAKRRVDLANGTVNRRLGHLRSVINRAAEAWEVAAPKIKWKKLFLDEPAEMEHVLSTEEEQRLFANLRPDFHGMVRFALVTGVRLDNCRSLTWRQVDWEAGVIRFLVKSKKPGGEVHFVPITPAVTAILSVEKGRNKQRVFTYVCARTRHDPERGVLQKKGERYPFTRDGWRKDWAAALKAAEITEFRFHDLRHTAATRALRAHRNLKTVQRLLGHKDIATTLRYTRSDVADVRAAMEAVEAQSRHSNVVPVDKKEDGSTG